MLFHRGCGFSHHKLQSHGGSWEYTHRETRVEEEEEEEEEEDDDDDDDDDDEGEGDAI